MAAVRRFFARRRNVAMSVVLLVLVAVGTFAAARRTTTPDLPTVLVTRGEFIDTLEIRGEIRPLKSIVLSSPMQSGDLQILKLAKSGTMVKPGDVLVRFDPSTLQRTIQEKQSELKQADAEIEQAQAQARIAREQNATAVMKAGYDIERAKLDVAKGDTVSRLDVEQAKLAVVDAQQRERELNEKVKSDETSAQADLSAKRHKREKALFDLRRAERGLENLELKAPASGMVNVLPNFRSGSMFGGQQEFQEGDRAWAGAAILELPDLSSVHLEARLDESDRGRLQAQQDATVRIEAIPGKDFKARLDNISVLAKVDFSSGWPPAKRFDLNLVFLEIDSKMRPGMTAVARIATQRVPDVTLVPSEAIFQRDGAPIVYKLDRSMFVETPITIRKRGKEQAIVDAGVGAGDRIATRKPQVEMIRRAE
ncbi:MAG TPA: efflux RND transporter periplasmic adaptor subunit [Vicinamibacterales bacterium]|jgi:HlyD family secretion protein|nr:efflux RND transporter periplasmic adaptor subunit [Vicinamibacterales bacterium]